MEVEGFIEGGFKVADMGGHVVERVAEMRKLIETKRIPMKNANIVKTI